MTCLLNKPAGLVCAKKDRENPTVMSLFPPEQQHMFPVGRLDKYSEGLLLVTDDGKLCRRLLDPAHHVEKRYYLWAAGEPDEAACNAIRGGLRLKGLPEPTRPCRFEIIERSVTGKLDVPVFPIRRPLLEQPDLPVFSARIWLTEGKRHQIKRMLEAVGCTVLYLRREAFGPLELDPCLSAGQYRPLTDAELALLCTAAGLPPAHEIPKSIPSKNR